MDLDGRMYFLSVPVRYVSIYGPPQITPNIYGSSSLHHIYRCLTLTFAFSISGQICPTMTQIFGWPGHPGKISPVQSGFGNI